MTAALATVPAAAQEARQIRLMVGFAPGGSTDVLARALSPEASRLLGEVLGGLPEKLREVAILYFVVPAVTRRPIYSHFLSMLGFWLLFFLYPLNGTHHYVFSVIPMAAQIGAITASALLGVDVIIVVTNLLLSLRGSGVFQIGRAHV